MANKRTRKPSDQKSLILQGYDWPSSLKKDGEELLYQHRCY